MTQIKFHRSKSSSMLANTVKKRQVWKTAMMAGQKKGAQGRKRQRVLTLNPQPSIRGINLSTD